MSGSPSEVGWLRLAGAACKLALVHHLRWEFLGKCVAKCSAVNACSGVSRAASRSKLSSGVVTSRVVVEVLVAVCTGVVDIESVAVLCL